MSNDFLIENAIVVTPERHAGVEAVSSDQITLSTIDSLKPAVVRGVGSDDYLYLLMPVRVP